MPEKNKLRVGVIGAGALGRHHTRLYSQNEAAELVGIFDTNPEVAQAVAAEYGAEIFPRMDELADACDGLSIAVPADKHYEVAMPLLNRSKHLLIEKPIATSVEHAEEMVKAAAENKVVLGVGHVERFNPVMSFFENMAEKIRFLEVHRLAPYPPERPGSYRRGTEVSVVLDLMIHDLDIILRLVNSEVEKIDANGFPALSSTDDVCNVRLRFKNGCVANVTSSRIAPGPMRKFRIFYADAYVSLDYAEPSGIIYTKDAGRMRINKDPIPITDHNALEEELKDFISCSLAADDLATPPATRVSGEHGLAALRLAIDIENEVRTFNQEYGFFMDEYQT